MNRFTINVLITTGGFIFLLAGTFGLSILLVAIGIILSTVSIILSVFQFRTHRIGPSILILISLICLSSALYFNFYGSSDSDDTREMILIPR